MMEVFDASASGEQPEAVRRIARFAAAWSMEATLPDPADVAPLSAIMPAGAQVYLSAVATHPHSRQVDAAITVHRAGLDAVPHLAARTFVSEAELDDMLRRMTEEAAVRRVLIIGGDRDDSLGPYASALAVIQSGLLQRHGISHVGIAAYPDGHPRIAEAVLDQALRSKLRAAEQGGLACHIASQFCLEPAVIVAWLRRLREAGVTIPVQVGMVGPTTLRTLMSYARRCGVLATARGAARNLRALSSLFSESTPDQTVRLLAEGGEALGAVAPHYFSFGGVLPTARWAATVAAGRITLDEKGGFGVQAA